MYTDNLNVSHILLTTLGRNPIDATYGIDSKTYSAKLSPIALFNLLPETERFNRVVALCTEDALNDTFPILKDSLLIPCEPKKIPDGGNDKELSEIVQIILHSIPANSELTLDLTHGLRPIPFLFFTSCLYLQALKGIRIRKAWYGKLERGKVSPFVDLSALLTMVEWVQAVQSFRDMRDPEVLVEKINGLSMTEIDNVVSKKFNGFVSNIRDFSNFFGAGLPLELGRVSTDIQSNYSTMTNKGLNLSEIPIPLAEDLIEEIASAAKPFILSIERSRGDWKQKYPLTLREIYREANLIDIYFDGGFYNNALGMFREFVINRCILSMEPNSNWLNKKNRGEMEKKLGALKDYHLKNKTALTAKQNLLASSWDVLTQGRNELHHHGMRTDNVKITRRSETLKKIWADLKSNLDDDEFWKADFGGGSGRLLISSLGLSPGLLYSAIYQVKPNTLLVIASSTSQNSLQKVIELFDCQVKVISCIMNDPFQGFDEIPDLVTASQNTLLEADEVFCNATGGTTTMQYAIMRLSESASRLGRQVKWVAMLDSRSAEEQHKNPFVVSEMKDLERSRWA